MKVNRLKINKTFFEGSKKYFIATIFIPPYKRKNITVLYNFSRYVDDLVDVKHYNQKQFTQFEYRFFQKLHKEQLFGEDIVDNFIQLTIEKDIDHQWIRALFEGVGTDTRNKQFERLADTEKYSYGVAEVVGLMVCKICNIDPNAYPYAQLAGRAAQWANFLRDANKDYQSGRIYFPKDEFRNSFQLPYSSEQFEEDIQKQIERYWDYRKRSKEGFKYLPWYLRFSVDLAGRFDDFIVKAIERDPTISFNKPFRFRHAVVTRTLKWM